MSSTQFLSLFDLSLLWNEEALYTLGSIVLAFCLFMRNILYFRLLHLFSNLFFLLYGIYLESISVIGTTVFLETINIYRITLLLLEMREAHLSPELTAIYKKYKTMIRPGRFKKMINSARKANYTKGEPLIAKGEPVHQLQFILEGKADVILDEKLIASLTPGNFIGEFGLLTNSAASASVYSEEKLSAAIWTKEEVDEIEELKLMIGTNVAEKLQKSNIPSAFRLFQSTSSYQKIVSSADEKIYTKEYIIREGERVDKLFLILEGKVEIEKRGRVIAKLTAGNFLGEFTLITGRKASASVVCRESAKMAYWDKAKVMKEPELKKMVYANISQKFGDVMEPSETEGDILLKNNEESINRASKRIYENEIIFHRGRIPSQLFLILNGEAEILDGDNVVGLVQPGDFLGEIAFFNRSPLSFSIKALHSVEVAVWKMEEIYREKALYNVLRERLAKKMVDIESAFVKELYE